MIVIFASACSSDTADNGDSPVLAKVGSRFLTLADLRRAVPIGLSTSDSAKYANAYIRRWVDGRLISDIAATEIDMTDIDRLVEEYRNRLIEMEYRRRMADAHALHEFPEDSLRNYYLTHNDNFILQRPMVQGVYLKVAEDAPNLSLIRRLYRSDRQADIDRLEKEVLTAAVHYDYFRDNWIDWEQIENHIPYDFGNRPETFLKSRDHFETTAGGFVYLLDIKDVLYPGAVMPFESAKLLISEHLAARERQTYDATLMKNLYDRSLADGKIQLFVNLEL